jgi:hypothetical protein
VQRIDVLRLLSWGGGGWKSGLLGVTEFEDVVLYFLGEMEEKRLESWVLESWTLEIGLLDSGVGKGEDWTPGCLGG